MKPVLVWLRLRWPRKVEADALLSTWRVLASSGGHPLVVESTGARGMVIHRLAVSYAKQKNVTRQLRAALPGIEVAEDAGTEGRQPLIAHRVLSVRLSSPYRALNTDSLASTCRAVLTALAGVHGDERLVLQWILGRQLAPRVVPGNAGPLFPSNSQLASHLLHGAPAKADSELRRALLKKQSEPGWRAVGRIAVVAADSHRQAQLLAQIAGALTTVEAPGVRLRFKQTGPKAVTEPALPWTWPLRLNVREGAAVSGWPVGELDELPVASVASRKLAPSPLIPRKGKIVAEATTDNGTRSLALSTTAALRHLHVLGPTGVGKSTTLLNLITQDIAAGHGVVVVEPKGDLIEDILARIPKDRMGDVVLVDPLDDQGVVGINPLGAMGRPPELVADQLLNVFHKLHAAHWGPRTSDILGNALSSLARLPNMTLVALPPLLTNSRFRGKLLEGVSDPIALDQFWSMYDSWTEAERSTAIAPVLNKVRPLILNPRLRAVLGQASPRFDISRVYTDRAILLANLSKGRIGPEAAGLLGSLILSMVWQAALARSSIPPQHRVPVFVYLDEAQDYMALPVDLAEALGQARGAGAGWVLAHQVLSQLEPTTRSAVLANARSRICFQLAAEDARTMAQASKLEPTDFMQLPAFECYTQLVAGDAVQPWCSARTLPATDPISDPAEVRKHSRQRWGTDLSDIEASITQLLDGSKKPSDTHEDLKPRKRTGGKL